MNTGGLHIIWMINYVLIGLYTQVKVISGDHLDVLGDRWIGEVQGASDFVQTQNELVNGLCV